MKDEPIMGCAEENPNEQPKCNPFGTRFLTDEARVFEHNAWDDVEWSEEQQNEAKQIVEKQKEMKVEEEKAAKLLSCPAEQWDAFYAQNENRFFKDRNWLLKEFPELSVKDPRNAENKKALLRLSCESLKFKPVFDEILQNKEASRMKHDPSVNGSVELLYVLLYETLAGSGLNRCSQELKCVVSRRINLLKELEKEMEKDGRGIKSIKQAAENEKKIEIPRYARINTLKWDPEEALKTLESEEWKIRQFSDVSKYAEEISSMKDDEVFVDPHVENLLIFPPNINNFHEYWMVEQRYIILQDKASCLPAFLLNPRPGSQVFDTCAAPGMKTSHAAAIMDNQGKIWAMDRASDRVETMKGLLDASKVAIASSFCGDFLKTDLHDKKFSKVEFAIVDPPCSGSGIVKRMDGITGGNAEKERLEKLKNLQAMILKHALKLPNLKRAVYSTCSVHEEENEQVVDEVLLDTYVRQNYVIKKNILPEWTHRGLSTYDIGKHCLRADPKVTLTNGFFVAVFERKQKTKKEKDN